MPEGTPGWDENPGTSPEQAGRGPSPGQNGSAAEEAAELAAFEAVVEGLGLSEAERQRDEYLDSLRRLQAEFDNYRKRVERQRRDMADAAASALVQKLLPVLDTVDLALAHGGGEDIKQVAGALFDILAKEGLQRIVPEGQPFDPQLHDAVAHDPDVAEGPRGVPQVSEVLRAGYEWRGRVLRPAMVKVRG